MKDTFVGTNYQIFFEGKKLNPHLEEVNHSPTGFSWGYGGSGPAQAAYAILRQYYLHISHSEESAVYLAKKYYQEFKWGVIARLPMEKNFEITMEQITEWLKKEEKRNA